MEYRGTFRGRRRGRSRRGLGGRGSSAFITSSSPKLKRNVEYSARELLSKPSPNLMKNLSLRHTLRDWAKSRGFSAWGLVRAVTIAIFIGGWVSGKISISFGHVDRHFHQSNFFHDFESCNGLIDSGLPLWAVCQLVGFKTDKTHQLHSKARTWSAYPSP